MYEPISITVQVQCDWSRGGSVSRIRRIYRRIYKDKSDLITNMELSVDICYIYYKNGFISIRAMLYKLNGNVSHELVFNIWSEKISRGLSLPQLSHKIKLNVKNLMVLFKMLRLEIIWNTLHKVSMDSTWGNVSLSIMNWNVKHLQMIQTHLLPTWLPSPPALCSWPSPSGHQWYTLEHFPTHLLGSELLPPPV